MNQHCGICGANPRGDVDPVTMVPHPVCPCSTPKIFNKTPPLNSHGESINCEMNKFDDMMAYLARRDPSFAEVIAVDASLDLFRPSLVHCRAGRSTADAAPYVERFFKFFL